MSNKRRHTIEFRTVLNASAEEAFAWHWQPDTLKKLIPPWEQVEIVQAAEGPVEGAIAKLRIRVGPLLKIDWIARHGEIIPDRQFADFQEKGPFAYWNHVHKFEPISAGRCALVDHIDYELPASMISDLIARKFVEAKLTRMFRFRHEVTENALKSRADRR